MRRSKEEGAARIERALVSLDAEVVDIDDEAQHLLALAKANREAFTRENLGTWGTDPEKLGEATIKKFGALVSSFEVIARTVNQLDKTRDLRAKKLRKEDYLKAAKALIRSLPERERAKILFELLTHHRRAQGGYAPTIRSLELEKEITEPAPPESPTAHAAEPEAEPTADDLSPEQLNEQP